MLSLNVRSAPINTGVEQLLWPAAILAAPFVWVHNLIFGSDLDSTKAANEEANKILAAHTEPIPVNGLYSGSISLRWAMYGLLVESRIPFLEIDTAGSAWLLSQAKAPQTLIPSAEKYKYIRLRLTPSMRKTSFVRRIGSDPGSDGRFDCRLIEKPTDI